MEVGENWPKTLSSLGPSKTLIRLWFICMYYSFCCRWTFWGTRTMHISSLTVALLLIIWLLEGWVAVVN